METTTPAQVAYADGVSTLLHGDVFAGLKFLSQCGIKVNCCVTSPPYWGLRINQGTERLWTVNQEQEQCGHGEYDPTKTPEPNKGRRQLPHGDGRAEDSYADERVPHPTAWQPSGLAGEHYTGASRWQHVGEEAQESGVKVRDVREGAWSARKEPSRGYVGGQSTLAGSTVAMEAGKEPAGSGSATCTLCNAWYGSLGLEPVLDCGRPANQLCATCYVCHMVLICREIREVLRDDGVCFINVGDSYIGSAGTETRPGSGRADGVVDGRNQRNRNGTLAQHGMKPKDLAQMPARLSLALQADGWWLRSDIIWGKGISLNKKGLEQIAAPRVEELEQALEPLGMEDSLVDDVMNAVSGLLADLEKELYVGNAMPESTQDRPTRGYEHIFMLTKQERYGSDMVAVREDNAASSMERFKDGSYTSGEEYSGRAAYLQQRSGLGPLSSGETYHVGNGRNLRNVWIFPTSGFGWHLCEHCQTVYNPQEYKRLPKIKVKADWRAKAALDDAPATTDETVNHMGGGNTGFQEEDNKGWLELGVCSGCGEHEHWGGHFSSFPETLPSTCIAMGSPPYVCQGCGAPYKRVVNKEKMEWKQSSRRSVMGEEGRYGLGGTMTNPPQVTTEGFIPTCTCVNQPPTSPIVLDPFCGTGTTLLAATKLGREGIGIELSGSYVAIAAERLRRADK